MSNIDEIMCEYIKNHCRTSTITHDGLSHGLGVWKEKGVVVGLVMKDMVQPWGRERDGENYVDLLCITL